MDDLKYLKTNFKRVVNPNTYEVYDFKKNKLVRKGRSHFPYFGYVCPECNIGCNQTSHYLIGKAAMCEPCALERIKLIRKRMIPIDMVSYHTKHQDGRPCSHPGCASHAIHPCEKCGRRGMKSVQREPEIPRKTRMPFTSYRKTGFSILKWLFR